jgi:DNA-binding NarL/FixJ family response regulator
LREGLALLRAESLEVLATTGNPDDFLAAVDKYEPDVAIVDVRMPPTHTTEGIASWRQSRRGNGIATWQCCTADSIERPSPA